MAVEVDHGHRSIRAIDRAKQRERDGVVTAKSDQTRQGLSIESRSLLVSICRRLAREEVIMSMLDLLERVRVIISRQC